MKALLCKEFGMPETLVLEDIEPLKAEAGKVVISVKACSVNFPDTLIIRNLYQFKPALPFSPGGEVSGLVKEVGEGVKHLKVGDKVFAMTGWGGMAEEVLVDARRVFPMLPKMDFVTAASVMYNYGTSYHALKDRAELKSGETLLVLGAAGGVGLAAVELGKLMGAKVIAAASSDEKLAVCKEKGADFTINYLTEDLREQIKTITEGKGVDVIYDAVGDKFAEPALRSIAWKGRYLVVGFAAGEIPKIPLNLALLKGCAIVGVFWGQFAEKEPAQNFKNIQELAGHFMQGRLRPHIHKLYTLEEAAESLNDLMNRKVVGKAVVVTSDEVKMPIYAQLESKQPEVKAETTPVKSQEMLIFKDIEALKGYVGKELGTSEWQILTQDKINAFAAATLDDQWIHVDEEKAKLSPFGKTIAHGFLSLSFSPKFMYEMFKVESAKMGLNYGTNKVRFISPVPVGSRVRMKATLKEVEDMQPSGAKLIIDAVFELEGSEKPACVAELLSVIYE
ncbi:Alcohol dehydrogenase zinc-binding domain protein [Emticicia oligotrophica DSM 17448]|uniref:Alcohol dehydrogenase zinc-binding domain protein n=1 Tax=Emticicia oligotrophica (strain DSM 17448 / CIP 109782 / MTCC 6937 / GPTSA100-15) TaxID=929562 RepID=A0ABN4AQR0_EMTOG|nr:zinc-binding dehydrogenase [Emticicia oligotrophica]AFK03616.1 Alcohol dehydrogenase zinc-binding domain protein [Emticicia oligotrophica DSM 17448]